METSNQRGTASNTNSSYAEDSIPSGSMISVLKRSSARRTKAAAVDDHIVTNGKDQDLKKLGEDLANDGPVTNPTEGI